MSDKRYHLRDGVVSDSELDLLQSLWIRICLPPPIHLSNGNRFVGTKRFTIIVFVDIIFFVNFHNLSIIKFKKENLWVVFQQLIPDLKLNFDFSNFQPTSLKNLFSKPEPTTSERIYNAIFGPEKETTFFEKIGNGFTYVLEAIRNLT